MLTHIGNQPGIVRANGSMVPSNYHSLQDKYIPSPLKQKGIILPPTSPVLDKYLSQTLNQFPQYSPQQQQFHSQSPSQFSPQRMQQLPQMVNGLGSPIKPQQILGQQPMLVVDLRQYEERWIKQIEELQDQLSNKTAEVVEKEKVVYFQDEQKLKEYEQEIELLSRDLDNQEDQNNQLQQEAIKTRQDLIKAKAEIKILENNQSIQIIENENIQSLLTTKEFELTSLKRIIADNETKLKQSQKQIQELVTQQNGLKDDNQDLVKQLKQAKNESLDKNKVIQELKDNQYQELQQQNQIIQSKIAEIEELNEILEEQKDFTQDSEDKCQQFIKEINTWKQKYIELNRDYSQSKQDLTMTTAELEQMKQELKGEKSNAIRQSQRTNTTMTRQQQNQRTTNSPRQSEKSTLNEKDIARIQQMTEGK